MVMLECGKLVPADCSECDKKGTCKACVYSCATCHKVGLLSCK